MGGKFSVRSDAETTNEMFSAIEKTINMKEPYFINEIATNVFKFFLDLDFYVKDFLEEKTFGQFQSILFSTVSRFFPKEIGQTDASLFESITLHAAPPPLLLSVEHLRDFLSLCRKGEVLQVEGGCIKKRNGDVHVVEWNGEAAADGSHTCSLSDDMRIVLLSDGKFSFCNKFDFVAEDASLFLRQGEMPQGAVSASLVAEGGLPWQFSSNTVFALSSGSWFVNSARDDQGFLKQGMHVIFPKILVGIEEALYMRESLLNELISAFGNVFGKESWENILDSNVYKTGGGLRPYGAHKTKDCPQCKGKKKRERDDECGIIGCKNGKIDSGRPNLLHSVYLDGERSSRLENLYNTNLNLLLRKTSIRTIEHNIHPQWKLYPGCPRLGDMLKKKIVKSGISHDIRSKSGVFKEDGKVKVGSRASEVADLRIHDLFQTHIRTRFVKQYSKLRVTKVQRGEKGIYFISVAGEGQHWCLNKVPASDHTSNTIYFEATKEGICVRCRCPKQTTENRAKGLCKNFKSSLKPLHAKEIEVLF